MKALTVSAAAVLASAAGLIAAPAADASTGCTTGSLPSAVVGNPAMHGGDAAAVYLWHDSHGWHLRATHPGLQTFEQWAMGQRLQR